jgi:hypothetical protein
MHAAFQRAASGLRSLRCSPASPAQCLLGKQERHRLSRKGNRQLNLALHRIAIIQARV